MKTSIHNIRRGFSLPSLITRDLPKKKSVNSRKCGLRGRCFSSFCATSRFTGACRKVLFLLAHRDSFASCHRDRPKPSPTAPSAGPWPPSCCACCGWGVRQTTCTCGRKHAAHCSMQGPSRNTHAPSQIEKDHGNPVSQNHLTYSVLQYMYLPYVTTSSNGFSTLAPPQPPPPGVALRTAGLPRPRHLNCLVEKTWRNGNFTIRYQHFSWGFIGM